MYLKSLKKFCCLWKIYSSAVILTSTGCSFSSAFFTVSIEARWRDSRSAKFADICNNNNNEARTNIHTFNGPFSGSTQVSRYQKGKTNLDFIAARDSEWQWHQMGHMQVCTSLQTDNHANTPLLSFFTSRMPFLPPNQQCQSTEGFDAVDNILTSTVYS